MFVRWLPVALLACSTGPVAPKPSGRPHEIPPGIDERLVDKSTDPCVDFFAYACGNFSTIYPMPKDRNNYGIGALVYENNEFVIHAMLDRVAANDPKRTASEQKTGDFYASCMNVDRIDKQGFGPLKAELDKIDALADKHGLGALLGYMSTLGSAAFLGFGEMQDFKDAKKQIAVVDQGGIGLPERDYYFRDDAKSNELRAQYVNHIEHVLVLLGSQHGDAKRDAEAIMRVETALAKASMDVTSRREPSAIYHPMTVADLAKLTPTIDWSALFQAAHAPAFAEINVTNPGFFTALEELLGATDLATIKTYLRWQLIVAAPGTALPSVLDQEKFDFFNKKLSGQAEQRARWKRCVAATEGAMGEAVGQVYAAQEFPPTTKSAAVQMVHDLEAAMVADIDALAWMSPETKAKAKAKLSAIADKIGYPDKFRDYSKLQIVRDDSLGNALRAQVFENDRQLAKIGREVDRGEWGSSPSTVDAFYNASMNDITFPAGILQPPLYDVRSPPQVNYGRVGAVIGHELTHGFDDQGRRFDGQGNLLDWWTETDGKKFEDLTRCEIDEYGNFSPLDGLKLNGKLTLGENTADNGGVQIAYRAFLADAKHRGVDPDAKKGTYTPAQEFFVAFGQVWCGQQSDEQVRLQVQTDPHSPRRFRVNGVVQNVPEFGKAFSCHAGQPMMPANACRVW
jgi:putative endopeptidase